MSRITICICTYQRPEGLRKCLRSLADIHCPEGAEVRITVIDNDPAGSAEAVVETTSRNLPWPTDYVREEKRGIPCARNRAIDEAIASESDYLVFIDDDEWVEPSWLQHLYGYNQSQGGQVIVSGAVRAQLPEGTPDDTAALFNKKRKPTGQKLTSCATDNVLIPVEVIKTLGLRFDESRPLAGGTDTIFFCHAARAGAEIVKCQEAVVNEDIPPNRLTLKWMARRKYRAGITTAWRKQFMGRSRIGIILSSLVQMVRNAVMMVVMWLMRNRVKHDLYFLAVCRSMGVAAGALGRAVDSYAQTDAREYGASTTSAPNGKGPNDKR